MDKSITKTTLPTWRETRFRQPGPLETRLGLWVDRIGAGGADPVAPRRLRILGQYAAVAVESGAGYLVLDAGAPTAVAPGDVILLTPAVPAAYAPHHAWYTRWVVWNGPEAAALARLGLPAGGAPMLHHAAAVVHQAFDALTRRMDAEDLAGAVERKAILLNMLAGLHRRTRPPAGAHEPALAAVIDHINRNLDAPLPLAELARLAHLSIPHFRRLFEKHTGRAPTAFIAAQRMAHAKALLAHGMPIKEAGARAGYPDPAYFMRVFRKVTGETAGQFQNSRFDEAHL